MSVLLLSDLFVQLNFNSFVVCYVQIFEQIKMDGWIWPLPCVQTKAVSYDQWTGNK